MCNVKNDMEYNIGVHERKHVYNCVLYYGDIYMKGLMVKCRFSYTIQK